jgi:hypothetical protein
MRTATTARPRLWGMVNIRGTLVVLFFPVAASVGGTGCSGDNSAGTKAPSQDASTSTDAQTDGGQEGAAGDDSSSGGGSSSSGGGSVGDSSTPGDASGIGDAPSRSTAGDAACVQADPTHWIYMCDAYQCDNHPGIPCGYTMTNGGQGYTCEIEFPGAADPWGCAKGGGDAGDAGVCMQADPTHWIYMCDPSQCDNHPGVPCGYTATNGGQGYTCGCEFPNDKEPWGCQPPDAGVGKACANGDAGHD